MLLSLKHCHVNFFEVPLIQIATTGPVEILWGNSYEAKENNYRISSFMRDRYRSDSPVCGVL